MPLKAIILCGGQGTRIRDVAEDIPKPMIRVGDRPIVWHIMKTYAYYGITDFVLCLGYKGDVIRDFFLNYRAMTTDISVSLGTGDVEFHTAHPENDWHVTLAETGISTQTGGRIARVRKYVEDSDIFCVTYGDGVGDIDIAKLIAFHRSHGRIGTITGVRPHGRFGVLSTASTGENLTLVSSFREKPQTSEGLINGGFFVFDHRLWDYLSDDENLIFEQEPLQRLSQDGQLALYELNTFWQPMDTYREWKLLNQLWESGDAPWKR